MSSFSKLNKHLLDRLENDETFHTKDFSFFKIFQHGVIYAHNKSKNKTLKTCFHWPIFLQKLKYRYSGFFKKKSKIAPVLKENLILEPGRIFTKENGDVVSIYFDKIQKIIDGKYSTILLRSNSQISCDYMLDNLMAANDPIDENESRMIIAVNEVAAKLKDSNWYTTLEKNYITSALHVFLDTYRKYYRLVKNSSVKRLYFIAHYHNEGIIAAMNDLNIEVIEIQHGLISKVDLYYCYNPRFSKHLERAFFPDKLILFGEYWKNILHDAAEWKQSQLIIGGEYMANAREKIVVAEKQNLIVVAAQKGMEKEYLPLISALKSQLLNHPEWHAIIKLHPLEKHPHLYEQFISPQISIAEKGVDITELFSRAKIQLSIYSTTIYDAIGYELKNYCWLYDGMGRDYAEAMVEQGAANGLEISEDPIELYLKNESVEKEHSRMYFYAPFEPSKFLVQ
jgi:hypothetical protein